MLSFFINPIGASVGSLGSYCQIRLVLFSCLVCALASQLHLHIARLVSFHDNLSLYSDKRLLLQRVEAEQGLMNIPYIYQILSLSLTHTHTTHSLNLALARSRSRARALSLSTNVVGLHAIVSIRMCSAARA